MADATQTMPFRFWLWLIRFVGLIVPRRLRTDWRHEWEAELRYREALLAEWDQLNWRTKLDLLWHSRAHWWMHSGCNRKDGRMKCLVSFRQSGLNSKLIVPPPSQFAERTPPGFSTAFLNRGKGNERNDPATFRHFESNPQLLQASAAKYDHWPEGGDPVTVDVPRRRLAWAQHYLATSSLDHMMF